MPVIEIINRTDHPVSTTIGSVQSGRGRFIRVPVDLVTKKIVIELEAFRTKNHIDYNVLQDPDIRDDVEQGAIGFPTAVDDILYFVDEVQGTDRNLGTTGNAPFKTLQAAIDKIPKNVNNFVVYIFLGPGDYSGVIKGIITANNDIHPIVDPLSEAYSFLFDSTRNGVIRIIGSTEGISQGSVTTATFNSLQDTSKAFVPDEHLGKSLRILNGPAEGEIVLIKGNTTDTIEADFFFNVPEPGDEYEIMTRGSNVELEINHCDGLILLDRCSLDNLTIKESKKIGLTNCKGSISGKNSQINAVYHFMNQLNEVNLYSSLCDIGFGSYIVGVERQEAEFFSIYSLLDVKLRQCGVSGTFIGTQDYRYGYCIFGKHTSQINLWECDADNCLGSLVVLVSSHGWIGQTDAGLIISLPNHILEGYLNSTYNDAGGNVFNSIGDNIKLSTGSTSVDSGGGGTGGTGVKIFPDEATLLAKIEDDGTIAFAELEGSYWLRSFNTWFEHFTPPQPPGTLVSQSLVLAGTTQYSAKIPSGLSSAWDPLTPGDVITNYIVDPTFTLDSPEPADRFLAGTVVGGQASAGILDLLEGGIIAESYDIGVNGIGTIGRISITDLLAHNAVFQRANAQFNMSLTAEGRNRIAMQHSESGLSAETELYYDNTNPTPSFASTPAGVINTKVSKWLSGIEAWGIGTTIDISYTAAVGIFEKSYHPTQVGRVIVPGHTTSYDNPSITPAVTDQFVVSRIITLDVSNQSSLSPTISVTLQKPNGANAVDASSLAAPINTYGVVSTGKDDRLFDEARRIILNTGTTSGTATPFNSTISLINGNAQQRHNGVLQYPDSVDYPGFTGDQEYQRFIDKVGSSVGLLTLAGISYTDIDPYGTGDLNVLLELAVEGKFFDLGRSIGDNNGTGSGNSRANSKGARNDSTSSGSIVGWSFGTDSTAFNNNEYRLIIIFRNNNHSISRITEA